MHWPPGRKNQSSVGKFLAPPYTEMVLGLQPQWQGCSQEISGGALSLPTRGLKYGKSGTMSRKVSEKFLAPPLGFVRVIHNSLSSL